MVLSREKHEQAWLWLTMQITVRILLEVFTYSMNKTKILRIRFSSSYSLIESHSHSIHLISQCFLAEYYMHKWRILLCDKEDNYTFSIRITRNKKYLHWEHESLNMFKTFVLGCRSYTDEKNTIRIDCHCHFCHCHCQNDQEWSPDQKRMVNSFSFGSRFGTVRLWHKRDSKGAWFSWIWRWLHFIAIVRL